MTPWMRTLHKWVGLIIGLQLLLWMASGVMMSWLDHDQVQGHEFQAHEHAAHEWPANARSPASFLGGNKKVSRVSSGWLLDTPVYQLADTQGITLANAVSGQPIALDAAWATRLAQASYTGPGTLKAPRLLEWSGEVRDHEGRLWRVDTDDGQDTTVYLSAQTGEVLYHRNKTWRLFDVFWMLHIMDYTGRKNFNNPLVVTAAIGGLWLALTGIWLLFASFHWSEFVPRRWRPARELSVFGPDGTRLRTVRASAGDNVYVSLAREGVQLPSNCGGGQSCGLCEVRFRGAAPKATAADRAHLGASKVKMGYRLACNLAVTEDTDVEVAGGASLWTEYGATVEQVTAVTPFLREIVLKPDEAPGPEYQPGAYLQVHVPNYEVPVNKLVRPEHHHQEWAGVDLPEKLVNREPVRRAYSLALPVDQAQGRLTLLARFSPGRSDKKRHPPGRGSTYLYTLSPGDRVCFSGPFGDFALKPHGREKVFIGGGAGMAPLRAMIRTLLAGQGGERIHFWYGARSLKEAPYIEEMERLAQQHENFSWHLVLSDEAQNDDALLRGLVHEVAHDRLLKAHQALADCEFYLCGPPAMLKATRELLTRLGVPDSQVAYDDFKI